MARAKWIFGAPQNTPGEDQKVIPIPPPSNADAKKFGLENFGNTCYANSVIQALYFCTPFRELLIQSEDRLLADGSQDALVAGQSTPPPSLAPPKPERRPSTSNGIPEAPSPPIVSSAPAPPPPPTLFSALRSLYIQISTSTTDKGTVAPRAFIDKVKEGNEIFRNSMHQDAHEFLNYLLNKIVEEVEEERKAQQDGELSNSIATLASKDHTTIMTSTTNSNSGRSPQDATLVHKLFEGILTSETRCLTCETVSARDESFLDLSIDIEQNSSVTACLRQFSASEMLCHKNKFFCDSCCDLQEAEKRMKIKKLPNVLALHLKRFKYQEDLGKYIKLAYRVAFPHELRLFNTVDDTDDADRLFNLFAIVVHIGNGPHHGHYISIIKTGGSWLVFDDESVYPLPESDIPKYFGESNAGAAYVLYYQAADIDLPGLGIRPPVEPDFVGSAHSSVDPFASPLQPPNPSLPPGLVEEENSSDLSDPPFPVTPSQSSSPLLQPLDKVGRQPLEVKVNGLDDLSYSAPSATPSSPALSTPTTNAAVPRKGLFGTVKRRPSTSNGPDVRPPVVNVPPVPVSSALDPTSVKEFDTSIQLAPGPSTSPGPASPLQEPSDPPRHKEPERKSSTWFKRKSGRLARPGSTQGFPDLLNSPVAPSGEGHPSWFKTTVKGRRPSEPSLVEPVGLTTFPARVRPKSSGAGLSAVDSRRRGHDYESSSPVGSVASSVGSTSPGMSHQSSSVPSTYDVTSSSPVRASFDKSGPSLKSPDHKKSLSQLPSLLKEKATVGRSIPRPATASGTGISSLPYRSEPPVPPLPKHYMPPLSPLHGMNGSVVTNGHAHHTGTSPGKGKSKSEPSDTLESLPLGQGSQSTSSSSSAGSNWKRTSRKLSLTMGFGKKDKKDREKEKEREREKEREKEGKGPPSAFPAQMTFTY